jgi:hypothetical protein
MQAQARLHDTQGRVRHWQEEVVAWETLYHARQRKERPHSQLAQARKKLGVQQRRQGRREQELSRAQRRVERCLSYLTQCQAEISHLQQRLQRFERENAANSAPTQAVVRLDAGFGTRENLALLIEMGYEVYSKPYGRWQLTQVLKRQVTDQTTWTRVGKNAEMIAWAACPVRDFPYPLDLGLERFHTGQTQRHSTLIHYGNDPVIDALSGWFHDYNGRQTIEAGIKEGKQVLQMHHLKVRSKPALYLQEHFAAFAANFVRWAAHWLATQCPNVPDGWQDPSTLAVKEQVQVAAHTSAWVTWLEQGCLLMFTDHSVYAGRSLHVRREWSYQMVLPFTKSCVFSTIRAP